MTSKVSRGQERLHLVELLCAAVGRSSVQSPPHAHRGQAQGRGEAPASTEAACPLL
jgi:hypothetical protein